MQVNIIVVKKNLRISISFNKFEKIPIKPSQMFKEFNSLSNDDLLTKDVHLIMRKS
jgi:hypothetical protein